MLSIKCLTNNTNTDDLHYQLLCLVQLIVVICGILKHVLPTVELDSAKSSAPLSHFVVRSFNCLYYCSFWPFPHFSVDFGLLAKIKMLALCAQVCERSTKARNHSHEVQIKKVRIFPISRYLILFFTAINRNYR